MSSARMEIRERQNGEVAIVELAGRLTINDEPGQLKEAVANALKRGAKLKLMRPSERVSRVLHMTHLETAFEIYEAEEDATGSFGATT